MKKGSYRFTIMNISNFKMFSSPLYKPTWKAVPSQPEWQRVSQTTSFSMNFPTCNKFSWNFDCIYSDNEVYFALVPPYSYEHSIKTLDLYQSLCPSDSTFIREVLAKSLDNRDIELITISSNKNFLPEREEKPLGSFPGTNPRCFKSTKPIIFIGTRVHPGETPSSYMLDSIIQTIISKDTRGLALRNNFVFKIIPMLNPDGVRRGHFRVDQNGINLNRCYACPSLLDQPSIYAAKTYIENVIASRVCFYLDLHAHGSKKGCFVYGNAMDMPRQAENELFAKLLELNSQFFEYRESDFNEKNMTAKDPKDHHSKEGSGRVAFYKSIGITHSYTVEASYHMPRTLHIIHPLVNMKTGRKCPEIPLAEKYFIQIYNRHMFMDIGSAILASILDIFRMNPLSRLPATDYKSLDMLKEHLIDYIKSKKNNKLKKSISRSEFPRQTNSYKVTDSGKKSSKLPMVTLPHSERVPEFTKNIPNRFKSTYKYSNRPKTIEMNTKLRNV